MTTDPFTSHIDYAALGDRLRAYRMGAGLQADEVAQQHPLGPHAAAFLRAAPAGHWRRVRRPLK